MNDQGIYDDWAGRWWAGTDRQLRVLHNLVPPRMRWFGPIVGDWRGMRVLDLGCGGGFMSEALAQSGARVIGVDLSEAALGAARLHATATGLRIDYRHGDAARIPVGDAEVDAVVCVDVLEHLPDLRAACTEVARVLRPGGWFLFDTINRTWLAKLVAIGIAERIGIVPRGTHDPTMLVRPEELRAAIEAAGMEPGRFAGMGPIGLNRRLDVVFGRVPTTAIQYLGSARRR